MAIKPGTFCVRQDNGRYRVVTEEEVCEYAADVLLGNLRNGKPICSPEDSAEFLKQKLGLRKAEVFAILWLDNRHRVIEFQELFHGTIDSASVYPREVVRHCIEKNAAACILAHNHPSGTPEPSQADIRITHKIRDALQTIDVRVLDHMVIGCNSHVSLAERSLI